MRARRAFLRAGDKRQMWQKLKRLVRSSIDALMVLVRLSAECGLRDGGPMSMVRFKLNYKLKYQTLNYIKRLA